MVFGIKKEVLRDLTILLLIAVFIYLAGCVSDNSDNLTIPVSIEKPPLTSQSPALSAETAQDPGQKLNVTIHSAQKIRLVQGIAPANDRLWVIVDASIENRFFMGGFVLDQTAIVLTNLSTGEVYPPAAGRLHLVDEWKWGIIAYNTTKRGEIVFVTNLSPDSYMLIVYDKQRIPIIKTGVQTIRYREYTHTVSDTTKNLIDGNNFTSVVNQLTTPEKTLQYMTDNFIFTYHDGVISYPAEVFFRIRTGDCKDYATFFSYVLSQHGYYAEMVSIKYADHGHTVTIFRDDDGQLKYQSSDKMNGFRNVTSLDDLLHKEMRRANAGPIVRYKVVPAGSVNLCSTPSGEC